MKIEKNIFLEFLFYHLPDFFLIPYIAALYFSVNKYSLNIPFPILIILGVAPFILIKTFVIIMFYKYYKYYYLNRLRDIKKTTDEFKRGKFLIYDKKISGNDRLANLSRELTIIGRYIDSTISALKGEIENLRELYNNIVFSISSYLIVLNVKQEIIFANDIFCKKFQLNLDDIIGNNIVDIFSSMAEQLTEAISKTSKSGKSVILDKVHILSENWISIIADIKISNMKLQGEKQIVLIMDDITSRCQKDYQINLISHLTESIQKDEEIHRILYNILFGITSGAGLGFNRAMLFLIDNNAKYLVGEMAVGPDSIDEALDIWNSIPSNCVDLVGQNDIYNDPQRKGQKFYNKVLKTKIDIETSNVFTQSFNNRENIHIYDSSSDERVDNTVKDLMQIDEFVVVPLIVENKAIGVIAADNIFTKTPIDDELVELLSIFALQASLSIDNHHKFTTLRKEMAKYQEKQEAIIESEKLAAIGRISAHIAHEIRNPLVTMGGYARRITHIAYSNEKARKAAEVILRESERLEGILANVMDLTKPQGLIKKLNNINHVITETTDLLKNLFQEKRIRIEMKLNADIPLINSDFNQMKQVLLNLIQNSIDATPSGGIVSISTDTDFNNVIICIRDTGTGIDKEEIDNIFEPFYSTKITGVGLGLAIVYKIIKDHNGEISVRNRENGGAIFTIILPIH